MPVAKREVDLNEVTRLAGLGLSQQQVGAALGLSRSTVQDRLGTTGKEGDQAFQAAYQAGLSSLASECAAILLNAARAGDTDSAKFLLRTRCGFTEKIAMQQDITVSSPMLNILLQGADGIAVPMN